MSTTEAATPAARVLSWQVTDEQLTAWGFPGEITDHIVGCKIVVQEGDRWGVRLWKAWAAGLVTFQTRPDWLARREAELAAFHARCAEQRRCAVDTLAELEAAGLVHRETALAAA